MPITLTCWKEIAEYLRKGVRTVQRYEGQMGLPVRRPDGQGSGVVLAFSNEIDAWMRSHFQSEGESELEALRKELAEVKRQNKLLRARLERERTERTAAVLIQLNVNADVAGWLDDQDWRMRASRAVERSLKIQERSAELIDSSRSIRELRRMQRERLLKIFRPSFINWASQASTRTLVPAGYLLALGFGMAEHEHQSLKEFRRLRVELAQTRARSMRSQIAAGLTYCTLTESELQNGNADHAHEMLERLQKLCDTLRRHLNEPNHVAPSEFGKVEIELMQLESGVHAIVEHERDNG